MVEAPNSFSQKPPLAALLPKTRPCRTNTEIYFVCHTGSKEITPHPELCRGQCTESYFQTEWIFICVYFLRVRWAVKLARAIQKPCIKSPPCKVPWQSMTLAGSMSFLVLAIMGSHTSAAQQQHCPWETELGAPPGRKRFGHMTVEALGQGWLAVPHCHMCWAESDSVLGAVVWLTQHSWGQDMPHTGAGNVVGQAQAHHKHALLFRMLGIPRWAWQHLYANRSKHNNY